MTLSPPAAKRVSNSLPRFSTVPKAASSAAGDEAIELAALAGLFLDPWQCDVMRGALGQTARGKWVASEVGVIVPRQSGKGSLLEARELAGLFLFDEKLILHSAHEFRTASEGFLRIRSLIDGSDDLRRKVLRVNASHGEEGITMRSGARLKFVARTRGSGRGFSGDVIVLDEAYALTDAHMSAMLPTLSARKNPQVWYTSSAPLLESETLRRFCGRGREGDKSVAYFEWAAAGDCESGDRDAWYAANPGMGIRLTEDFTEREFAAMDDVSFRRERLGIWEMEDTRPPVIAAALWEALRDPGSKIKGNRFVMALDVNPSRTMSTIAVAGARHDGLTHVEVLDRRGDVHWVVPRFRELRAKWGYVDCVIDERSAAWSFASALHDAGVTVIPANTRATTDSAGRFFDACQLGTASLRHLGQPELNDALHAAVPRPLGDAYAWDKRKSDADITALVAVSLAHWEWERANVVASIGIF